MKKSIKAALSAILVLTIITFLFKNTALESYALPANVFDYLNPNLTVDYVFPDSVTVGGTIPDNTSLSGSGVGISQFNIIWVYEDSASGFLPYGGTAWNVAACRTYTENVHYGLAFYIAFDVDPGALVNLTVNGQTEIISEFSPAVYTVQLFVKDLGYLASDGHFASQPTPPEPSGNYLDPLYNKFNEAIALGSTNPVEWNVDSALPHDIMQVLYKNPALSLVFRFTYEGQEHEVYIAPGQATNDDIEYYGPAWLIGKYGDRLAEPKSYTIQKNDTLNKLAKKFGTSVEELLMKNPYIKDKNKIYPGNKINY